MLNKKAIMRIQLGASAKAELERFCDRRGMTQVSVVSRLVAWFVDQDEVVQTAVMSSLSESSMAKLAREMLKKLASDRGGR